MIDEQQPQEAPALVPNTQRRPSLPGPLVAPSSEEPYSIFDKRQKALIVLIVSTAATCESTTLRRL